jgi:hypothetical protein
MISRILSFLLPSKQEPTPQQRLHQLVTATADSWEIRRYRIKRAEQLQRRSPERKERFASAIEGLR